MELPETPPGTVELADMVSEADKAFHEAGLKTLGASDNLLKRIRDLDGLAKTSGGFIAISLEKTARSYYVQVMELMETAHQLRQRLMAKKGEEGYVADDEARAFFNKNYLEMVKEAGRAYQLMLMGAEAMVKMLILTKGDDPSGGTKKKPGWRKVTAVEQQNAQAGS